MPLTRKSILWVVAAGAAAAALLAHLYRQEDSYRGLIETLSDPDEAVASTAAMELAGAGQPVLGDLLAAATDPRPAVRARVAHILGLVKPVSSSTVALLTSMLDDEDWRVRWGAVSGLQAAGSAAVGAVSRLEKVAVDADEPQAIRVDALRALGAIGPGAEPAVPGLISCLENSSIGLASAEALEAIGPKARPALPGLRRLEIESMANPNLLAAVKAAIRAVTRAGG